MIKRTVLLASLVLAMPITAHADDNHDRDRYRDSDRTYRNDDRTYHGRSRYDHCRHSSGTTGLVAGGVGGAVLGGGLIGGGLAGPLIGGVAGALGGRAIDRSMTAKKRCR